MSFIEAFPNHGVERKKMMVPLNGFNVVELSNAANSTLDYDKARISVERLSGKSAQTQVLKISGKVEGRTRLHAKSRHHTRAIPELDTFLTFAKDYRKPDAMLNVFFCDAVVKVDQYRQYTEGSGYTYGLDIAIGKYDHINDSIRKYGRTLAHEIGHALRVSHQEHSIMWESSTSTKVFLDWLPLIDES